MTLFTAFSKIEEIQLQRLVYLKKTLLVMHGKAEMVLLAPEKTQAKPSPVLWCRNWGSQWHVEPR